MIRHEKMRAFVLQVSGQDLPDSLAAQDPRQPVAGTVGKVIQEVGDGEKKGAEIRGLC